LFDEREDVDDTRIWTPMDLRTSVGLRLVARDASISAKHCVPGRVVDRTRLGIAEVDHAVY